MRVSFCSLAFLSFALSACGGSTPAPAAPSENAIEHGAESAADSVSDTADELTQAGQQATDSVADVAKDAVSEVAVPVESPLKMLPEPPFKRFVADDVSESAFDSGARKPKLVQVSVKRNQITDDDRWFKDNQLALPTQRFATADAATPRYSGLPLRRRIDSELTLSLYGSYGDPRAFLVGTDPTDDSVRFAFDLTAYSVLPGDSGGRDSFTMLDLSWAWVDGDRLYLGHSHNTYAETSNGINSFITAIRIPDGALLWQSRPLVNNAANFALTKAGEREVLVTGYGFTAEPDFLFLLDPSTGAVLHRVKLRKGPSFIIPKDGLIYVRTYDRDYVFRIKP